jgi:hypothetical protein
MIGLGIAPITTCPHCSKLINNSCVVCGPDDPHPSCESCEEGRLAIPWYRSELFLAILTTVVVTVASTIIVGRIQEAMKRKKS